MSAKVQKKLDIISNSLEKLPNSKLFRTFAPKYSIKSGIMPTNRPSIESLAAVVKGCE